MKGIGLGVFLALFYIALNLDNDPLGWHARERAAQLALQQAQLYAHIQLEQTRLEQAAALQQAQFRAQLLKKYVSVLPLTLGILSAAVLVGLLIHYRSRPGRGIARSLSAHSPGLRITHQDLAHLRRQAHACGYRMDVARKGMHHQALLIDNATGTVRAQRMFWLETNPGGILASSMAIYMDV